MAKTVKGKVKKAAPAKRAAKSVKIVKKAAPAKKAATPKAKALKYVYSFGNAKAEGGAAMKNLLGGKGANLAEMCLLGIPVPAGFTVSTECCTAYYANGCKLPAVLADLTAVVAANGRAQSLSEAERAAAAEQGREQRRRFLTPGSGYQPGNARMFPSGN